MDLKELLGEELFEQVQAKAQESDVKLMVNDGSYIPRERLNAKSEEIDNLKSQLDQRDKQIGDLKKSGDASEELKSKISELEEQNKQTQQELETKLHQQRLDAEVEKELLKNNARNPKAVKALLELDKVDVGDEGVKGLSEQLEKLRESEPYLFEGESKTPKGGDGGFAGDTSAPLTREAIEQMSNEEINSRWEEVQKVLSNN